MPQVGISNEQPENPHHINIAINSQMQQEILLQCSEDILFQVSPQQSFSTSTPILPSGNTFHANDFALPGAHSIRQHHPSQLQNAYQLSGRTPSALSNYGSAQVAPYTLPGVRFVPAFAPMRENETIQGLQVTGSVFCPGTDIMVTG
ncbi:hypothetical protein M404DRAFT_35506 [Pisolithus tinctorius Marx 270]|uniref:Uncharacterized protein n=1 Tax=Pisolithus tinctorius Marx 270 TaxID=870435 RepID=A0A0C3MYM2_PISTI|nr:hypothetical protein M404DRAFT_35506 [Pisolithus tinctorius Marx 270]